MLKRLAMGFLTPLCVGTERVRVKRLHTRGQKLPYMGSKNPAKSAVWVALRPACDTDVRRRRGAGGRPAGGSRALYVTSPTQKVSGAKNENV